jgi:hypothetical protein
MKKREVPTDADLPLISRSHRRERAVVAGYDVIQNPLDSTNVRLSLLVVTKGHPIGRCNMLMDKQTLHDLCESPCILRQTFEQVGVASSIAHSGRIPVSILVSPHAFSWNSHPKPPFSLFVHGISSNSIADDEGCY